MTRLALILAAALAAAPLALAHFPPSPNLNCEDGTDANGDNVPHDFVARSAAASTGATGDVEGGVFVEPSLFDGSSFGLGSACGSEPLCPSGETVLVVDPSGDDLPDGTDPSGDDVVLACDDVLVGGTQVPVGDGEYEFGLGLQFLPASHHDPKAHGYTVAPVGTVGGFVFGADLDSDGDVEDGSDDCYESHDLPGAHTTACDAGMDDGWWFFPTCRAEAFPDSQAEPGDPVAYFTRDRDFNGSPDWLDDRDSDGQPDGIQDWDGDGHPDALTSWNEVALGDPDPGAGCTAAGHINSD